MTSENVSIDDVGAEDRSRENDDISENDYVHPRVTAKKTFFDIHRNRRSSINVGISESETNFHPRTTWSAGTTDVGSRYQSTVYDELSIRDPMQPILRSQSSVHDLASTVINPRPNLPPVPGTWGAIDAQPTQLEEVAHLIAPSLALEVPDISQDVITKPRKKFLEKFRKRSTLRVDPKTPRESRLLEDDAERIKPEEEFQRLNESYVRDGVLSAEDLHKEDEIPSGPRNLQARFKIAVAGSCLENLPGSRVNGSGITSYVDARSHHKYDSRVPGTSVDERSNRQFDTDKDCMPSTRLPFNEKHMTIDIARNDNSSISECETRTSLQPARRSCEPLNVKDLRKLRDSDLKPGPSVVDSTSRDLISKIVDDVFAMGTQKISILDAAYEAKSLEITQSDSDDSLGGTSKETISNLDRFEIDNPFSDFSLQTIGRNKNPPKPHPKGIKKIPRYLDPALPSTSKATPVDAYRQKVSHREIVESPEGEIREQSSPQSGVSRMKKTLFSGKAVMTECSRGMLDARSTTSFADKREDDSGIDQLASVSLLCLAIRRVLGEHFFRSYVPLKDEADCATGTIVFDCRNDNFKHLPTSLMDDVVISTFAYLFQNCLSNLSLSLAGSTLVPVPVIRQNCSSSNEISLLMTTCPSIIFDVTDVTRIRSKKLRTGYLNSLGKYELCHVAETLRSRDDRKNDLTPFLQNNPARVVSLRGNLMGKITRYVVDVIISQNFFGAFSFSSFGSVTALTPTGRTFQGFKYNNILSFHCRTENDRALLVELAATPIVIFLEKFLNLRQMYKA